MIAPARTSGGIQSELKGVRNLFSFILLMRKYPLPWEMLKRKIVWADAQIWGVPWGGEICASGAPGDFSRSYDTPTGPHENTRSTVTNRADKVP